MNKGMIQQMIAEAKEAAKVAVAQTKTMLGRTNDPDLEIYNRLGPADFEGMKAEHGVEAVTEYINTMEVKRLKGG